MHAAHQTHCLVGVLGGQVAQRDHTGKLIIREQIHRDLTVAFSRDGDAHVDHERARAEHHVAAADVAGQTAVNDAEVVGGEGERRMRPGGFAQRAAKLKTCRICECRSAGENARFVELDRPP